MPSYPIVPYPVRMPPQLRERLTAQAKLNSHSLHAEIIGILQGAVEGGHALSSGFDVNSLADAIADRLEARAKAR